MKKNYIFLSMFFINLLLVSCTKSPFNCCVHAIFQYGIVLNYPYSQSIIKNNIFDTPEIIIKNLSSKQIVNGYFGLGLYSNFAYDIISINNRTTTLNNNGSSMWGGSGLNWVSSYLKKDSSQKGVQLGILIDTGNALYLSIQDLEIFFLTPNQRKFLEDMLLSRPVLKDRNYELSYLKWNKYEITTISYGQTYKDTLGIIFTEFAREKIWPQGWNQIIQDVSEFNPYPVLFSKSKIWQTVVVNKYRFPRQDPNPSKIEFY